MAEPRKAFALGVSQCVCGCQQFHFELQGEDGETFAIAIIPPEAALMIAEKIAEGVLGSELDTIGKVEGHA